jgi:hypothetical protein
VTRHLTRENHDELLAAASGTKKREVEELLARRYPQPDVPSSVRALPACPMATSGPSDPSMPHVPLIDITPAESHVPLMPAAAPYPLVRPLAPERYEIRFTASGESLEKLRLAQDMLSHSVPSGDLAQVFDRALTALLEDLSRRRFAETQRPRPSRGRTGESDNVGAAVKRLVSGSGHGSLPVRVP